MKNNASQIYNIFLIFGDFLALIAAFAGAFVLRVTLSDIPIANPVPAITYLKIFLLVTPFWILIFALLGLYNSSIHEKRFVEFGRLLIGSFIGLLFVIFINFLSAEPLFPAKLVPIYGFGLGFLFLLVFRNLARLVRTELFSFKVGLDHVLIVGNTIMTAELVELLRSSRQSGYKILGVIGTQHALGLNSHRDDIPVYPEFKTALAHITEPVHTIIQTELYADEARNRDLLEYAQSHHVAFRFVPGNTELFVGNIDVQLFRGSIPVIAIHQTALIGWGRIVKRIFDFAAAALILLAVSPIMLIIAVILKIVDPGPIFLRQTRLTRFNSEFKVFKFRSMKKTYNGMTPEQAFTKMNRPELINIYRQNGDQLPNDPRITPIGHFLRRSSLDELPQLFNVLKGDISLVGPRALVPEELSVYEKRHTILSVKSGLTGLAQVSGRRNISFDERRKLDIFYVQNWSFWLDLVILVKTIRVVLERTGAE
ncbi:MAG TPA: sugar transferase [Candidatus Saccharimonadales bacterium]|jgi:exopolysaccharide biosynthesis polyprenyl glycosylphosphotransferase